VYAPNACQGLSGAVPKETLLAENGLLAWYALWQARSRLTVDRLEQLAALKTDEG
jgi:hypothetical protein